MNNPSNLRRLLCLAIGVGLICGYWLWSASDLRRRLVGAAAASERDFCVVAVEALDWPAAWKDDPVVAEGILVAAEKGWSVALRLARYVDGDKDRFWRMACRLMKGGSEAASYEAAGALGKLDESMPEWVMTDVWDYAVVCGLSGDRKRVAVAKVALDGVAQSSGGRRLLRASLSSAGDRGRAAMHALGLDNLDLIWRH